MLRSKAQIESISSKEGWVPDFMGNHTKMKKTIQPKNPKKKKQPKSHTTPTI